MIDLLAATDGVPPWLVVVTAALPVLGVIAGQLMARLGERDTRADALKSYRRNIYRNFLDHGYWLTQDHDDLDDEKRQERAGLYVADWHRIRLITDDEQILHLTKTLKPYTNFNEGVAEALEAAFRRELGHGGLSEP